MQSRFNKILSSGLTCSLTGSMFLGNCGNQVAFAEVNERYIDYFVKQSEGCLDGTCNYWTMVIFNTAKMNEETCKEIYRRADRDKRILLALGMFVVRGRWEEVEVFLAKIGLIKKRYFGSNSRTDKAVVDLLVRVFKEIEGADFLKFISAFNVDSEGVTLLSKLKDSVGETKFLEKVTSGSQIVVRVADHLEGVKEGYAGGLSTVK